MIRSIALALLIGFHFLSIVVFAQTADIFIPTNGRHFKNQAVQRQLYFFHRHN